MTDDARDEAVHRLEGAQSEELRLAIAFRASVGTTQEFGAYARLRSGRKDVVIRQAWLDRVTAEAATATRAAKVAALTGDEHTVAMDRLETALVEQTRSGGRYRSALGTTNKLGAYVRPRGDDEQG